MDDKEIYSYIKENMAKGYSAEQIRKALLSAGYPENVVNSAINNTSFGMQTRDDKKVIIQEVSQLSREPAPKWMMVMIVILLIIILLGGIALILLNI
jgi:SOS response regulatory protein OraA/RecX